MIMTLANKQIAITRDLRKAAEFAQVLHAHDAVPLIYPCIEIVPPPSTRELDHALERLLKGEFDWVVFSSQNAVEAIVTRLEALGYSTDLFKVVRCAAVGSATASAAKAAFGFGQVLVPKVYSSASLAELFKDFKGKRVFVPRSKIARTEISEKLSEVGAQVCATVAYSTKKASGGVDLPDLVKRGEVDAIAFASPSAVRFFGERFLEEGGSHESLKKVCIACIGDITKEAARNTGLRVDVVPSEHTVERLVTAIDEYFN